MRVPFTRVEARSAASSARATLALLSASVGAEGLAAAAARPGLLALVDQHAAAVRESLDGDRRPLSAAALAGYAEGVRAAALEHGWQPPAAPVDWSAAGLAAHPAARGLRADPLARSPGDRSAPAGLKPGRAPDPGRTRRRAPARRGHPSPSRSPPGQRRNCWVSSLTFPDWYVPRPPAVADSCPRGMTWVRSAAVRSAICRLDVALTGLPGLAVLLHRPRLLGRPVQPAFPAVLHRPHQAAADADDQDAGHGGEHRDQHRRGHRGGDAHLVQRGDHTERDDEDRRQVGQDLAVRRARPAPR